MIRRFFVWLFCRCTYADRKHESGPAGSAYQDWGRSECTRCGRKWLHFRDAAWRIR